MTIKAIRVSRTSMKFVDLYGPIEAALKTLIQAKALQVKPLHVLHHGDDLSLEMWINTEEASVFEGTPNIPAIAILANAEMERNGIDVEGTSFEELIQMVSKGDFPAVPVVNGPAILTGAGCADIPDAHLECLVHALMGGDAE